MTKKIATWVGLTFLVLAALYLVVSTIGLLTENLDAGTFLAGGVIGTVGIVLLAALLLPVFLIVLALRIAKNEKFSGAHAVGIIAVLVTLGGLYWYAYRSTTRLDQVATGGGGGAVNAPPLRTDIPIRDPWDVQEATKSWDPSKPPMAAEPKAPAFVLASGLDASKPFAGSDLSKARWCEMCASGKLRQKSYDLLGCKPELCK